MKKGALFKTVRVMLVLVAALVIAALLIALRPEAQRQLPVEKGRLVEVMPAKAESILLLIEAYGTVKPREALKIISEVRGLIVEVAPAFKEGSFINKGQTLIRIDPRDYALEVERRKVQVSQVEAEIKRLEQEVINLKATMKIAKSDTTLALNDLERTKKLIEKNVVAQSTLEKTEQRYLASLERLQALDNQMALTGPQKDLLIAQLDMAKVSLRQAELNLERATINAPFDGWVLEKEIEVGQHVNAGQYLGTIYMSGVLEIEVHIPVKDLKWFPDDMRQVTSLEADIIFNNDGTPVSWKGRVARIKAQMEERTRTLPLVVEVDKGVESSSSLSSFLLRPGVFVTVKIKGRQVEHVFVLPRHVVHPGNVVYIFKDDLLTIREVHVLRAFKDTVIVDEGLSEGDLIVSTPLSSAVEGMRVRLQADDR